MTANLYSPLHVIIIAVQLFRGNGRIVAALFHGHCLSVVSA